MPNISININQKVLMGPGGKKLLADLKRAKQAVFAWTVNEESLMRWSIEKGVDGVVTDDPEMFRRVCDEWDAEGDELKVGKARVVRMTFGQKVNVFVISAGAYLASGLLMLAFRGRIQKFAKGRKSLGHDDRTSK